MRCIAAATAALAEAQRRDGHWVFELEADATIPAEYVLLQHYPGRARSGPRSQDRELSAADAGRRTAAGRCFTTVRSTSAPASRRTSR